MLKLKSNLVAFLSFIAVSFELCIGIQALGFGNFLVYTHRLQLDPCKVWINLSALIFSTYSFP